jgi:hypothetical protein
VDAESVQSVTELRLVKFPGCEVEKMLYVSLSDKEEPGDCDQNF